jgi:hypothetical protein|tara:strand:- start:106 stop:249 length:144 start_codon:yes stop_codon:yes gene_type:complete
MESFTVTDQIFAELAIEAKESCTVEKMPFETESLIKIRKDLINTANK